MSAFVANNAVLSAAATPFTPSFETDAPYDMEQHLYDSPANIAHDNQVAINFLTAHNAPAEFWEQAGYEDPRLSGPRVRAEHPGAVLLLDAMEREREDRIAKLEKRVDLMHLSSDISDTSAMGLIAPTPLASPQSSLRHRQDQGVPLPPSPPWSPAPVRQMVERSQKKKNRKSPMTRSGQRCRPSDKSRQVQMKLKVEVAGLQDRYGFALIVVKVSWPSVRHFCKKNFLNKAAEEAEKEGLTWATKHLPKVLWAGDINFGKDSTFESVANLFESATLVGGGGNFVYEKCVLWVIIQEELHPLKSLGDVFVDVACVHRWLHNHPGILHRDPSPNNIMYRISEEPSAEGKPSRRVYGVLTDYDLLSWMEHLKTNCGKTPQQQTGTPPYMAHELLMGASATHLRHELANEKVESTTGPLQMVMRGGYRPYQGWFKQQDYDILGSQKFAFFSSSSPIELSLCFKDFRAWLQPLQFQFMKSFSLKTSYVADLKNHQYLGGSPDDVRPTRPLQFNSTLAIQTLHTQGANTQL
ncbi:hypothetical protein BJ322DRAFT_1105541 [Thelephora terrestris]|uniref:Fungal-type protein kinase domain-containing protein n=1 Tax=Thelephora terrestris TaxID=56493 RepID=A0A9P6HMT1_9AGAM|nr:hypothetical protein BJ322DRAFT_1105541 [Thelephora terrestris]